MSLGLNYSSPANRRSSRKNSGNNKSLRSKISFFRSRNSRSPRRNIQFELLRKNYIFFGNISPNIYSTKGFLLVRKLKALILITEYATSCYIYKVKVKIYSLSFVVCRFIDNEILFKRLKGVFR